MNRETAKALLPIIQAFAEGKTIESSNTRGSDWFEHKEDVTFNLEPTRYRIKPEPREFWIVNWNDGHTTVYSQKPSTDGAIVNHPNFRNMIHVKEVISEE